MTSPAHWPYPTAADRRRAHSDPELQAMVRDGLLRGHAQSYLVPADLARYSRWRACALAPLLSPPCVVAGLAATWVHAGGTPPDPIWLAFRHGARRPAPSPYIRSYPTSFAPADVISLAGVPVTSVRRTGLDLAIMLPPAEAVEALAHLIAFGGFDPAAALAHTPERRLNRSARAVLTGFVG